MQHVDRIPGTDCQLVQITAVVGRSITHLATDAATGIDLMVAFRRYRADHFVDAVNGANRRARIAGRAAVLINDVDVASFFFPIRFAGPEVIRH